MNLTSLTTRARKNLTNVPGWKTKRKILVIESDDWGSIRMPSTNAFEKLDNAGIDLKSLDAERYNKYDTLASSSDLENLFEVLSGIKDSLGNYPVFTAISIVANPDFQKIKENGFNQYCYEPFTETLKGYSGCEHAFELWEEGIRNKLFVPQFHGREHLNVKAWMKALKSGDKQTRLTFDEGMWGFVPDQNIMPRVDYQAAFLLSDLEELDLHKKILEEGIVLFMQIFGFIPELFVSPNGLMNNELNDLLMQHGVKYRAASRIQYEPVGHGRIKKTIHLGNKDKSGIRYLYRNCVFEPSQPGNDWIDSCLRDVNIAFRWHNPAIISSHRVNYIGSLYPENRDRGLKQLKTLLNTVLKKWPEVEFMISPSLGHLMETNLY